MNRRGSGFAGSEGIYTTEIENEEVVPKAPSHWDGVDFSFYKFSFLNYEPCRVSINNGNPIFLREEQGFESNEMDALIYSFVILESGINYQWIGCY